MFDLSCICWCFVSFECANSFVFLTLVCVPLFLCKMCEFAVAVGMLIDFSIQYTTWLFVYCRCSKSSTMSALNAFRKPRKPWIWRYSLWHVAAPIPALQCLSFDISLFLSIFYEIYCGFSLIFFCYFDVFPLIFRGILHGTSILPCRCISFGAARCLNEKWRRKSLASLLVQ